MFSSLNVFLFLSDFKEKHMFFWIKKKENVMEMLKTSFNSFTFLCKFFFKFENKLCLYDDKLKDLWLNDQRFLLGNKK